MTVIPLDKFYTPDAIARRCVGELWRQVRMRPDDLFIEPSAGAGAFCRHLPADRTIALDIAPDSEGILTADFLQFEPPAHRGRRIVIGNPPFGRNGAMARAFLRHAAGFADVIVFILPASFAKPSMHRSIDPHCHLVHQTHLGDSSFETCEGLRKVRTVLQIWEKRDHPRAEHSCFRAQEDFEFVRDIRDADLVVRRVGMRAGAVLDVPQLIEGERAPSGYSASSNYYIRAKACDAEILAHRLRALDLAAVAAAAVCPSLSMQELVSVYAAIHVSAEPEIDAALPMPAKVSAGDDVAACSSSEKPKKTDPDEVPRREQGEAARQGIHSRPVLADLRTRLRARRAVVDLMRAREGGRWQGGQTCHAVPRPGARQGIAPRPPDRMSAGSLASRA